MTAPDEKEIREQRHDFIKEYYKMATADLDRHLKVSWQTIAVVAGGVVSISLAQEGKLPIPFAVSAALGVALWGLWNIIDGNYWSIRAIAFLANVESIYFAEEDRRNFNPYAGFHPPYKLLDSLKYQFLVVLLYFVLIVCYFVWRIFGIDYGVFIGKFVKLDVVTIGFWMLPIITAAFGTWYTIRIWVTRIDDYLRFVEQAPGPGMVKTLPVDRSVDLVTQVAGKEIVSGSDIQRNLVINLRALSQKWRSIHRLSNAVLVIGVLLAVFLIWKIRWGY